MKELAWGAGILLVIAAALIGGFFFIVDCLPK
jgi:hypothetical protein